MIFVHHLLWHYLQCAALIPANGMLIYRFLTRKADYTQYEVREQYSSYWQAVNLFDLRRRTETKKDKPFLEEDWLDRAYRTFLAVCIFYYVADIAVKLYEFDFPGDYLNGCNMGFFIHHLISIAGFKSILLVDHYAWFLTGPMSYHTMMVAFP